MQAVSAIAAAHIATRLEEARLDFSIPIVRNTARWVDETNKPVIEPDSGSTIFVGKNFTRGNLGFRGGKIRELRPVKQAEAMLDRARQKGDKEIIAHTEKRATKIKGRVKKHRNQAYDRCRLSEIKTQGSRRKVTHMKGTDKRPHGDCFDPDLAAYGLTPDEMETFHRIPITDHYMNF